jgi:hypothetical protein
MSAPGCTIILTLESRPRVIPDAPHSQEEERLRNWLEASGYVELVERAQELAEEEPAA